MTLASHRRTSPMPHGGRALSPEARLLLCTAAGGDADDAIRELLPRITNWPRLVELGIAEGAHPVLGARVRIAAPKAIPTDVRGALEYIERAAMVRQRYLLRRLGDALRVLSEAAIPVVLLKGAALVHTTYTSPLDRPMSDIDLLVRPADARAAQELLAGAEWQQRYDREFDSFYETMHHLPPMVDRRAPLFGVGLEVHTGILPSDRDPFTFPPERMWESALAANGLPRGTLVPSTMHRLLHCCLHFGWSHKLSKGAWRAFSDVAAMARHDAIDWDEFAIAANSTGAATACYWTLRLAHALTNAPVPVETLVALRPRRSARSLDILERHFSHAITGAERICPSDRLQDAIWTFAFRPGRTADGRETSWEGEERAWHLMHERASKTSRARSPRLITSPSAWLRYARSIIGIATRSSAVA